MIYCTRYMYLINLINNSHSLLNNEHPQLDLSFTNLIVSQSRVIAQSTDVHQFLEALLVATALHLTAVQGTREKITDVKIAEVLDVQCHANFTLYMYTVYVKIFTRRNFANPRLPLYCRNIWWNNFCQCGKVTISSM